MKKLTFKIWLLIVFVIFSVIAIFGLPPKFLQTGVIISNIEATSPLYADGLRPDMIITEINSQNIANVEDYNVVMSEIANGPENQKVIITTNAIELIGMYDRDSITGISTKDIAKTNLNTGLDLQGGIRVLIGVENGTLDADQVAELISISEERLNVYGLSDVNFFKVEKAKDAYLMGIEISGSTPDDIESLVASQGKFEAKIGDDVVFVGGKEDITHIGKTGTDAMITECNSYESGDVCRFVFVISLSNEAAQRHANITSGLSVNHTSTGSYLSEKIDFFVDDVLTTSLNIGADLKGNAATSIQISGSGEGVSREEAIDNAKNEMKKLQAILSTGSIPYSLSIEKLDRVSPTLGEKFVKQILLAGLVAIIAVSLVVLVRYRKLKLSSILVLVSLSEVLIILGVAALIKWNLSLPSIAGIIAAIGTGIDSQIVILDETLDKNESIREQIKKALFIIGTAFATTFVALIPLTGSLGFMGITAAGAGLLKGFAVTTIIGLIVGVTISRPAFADIVRLMGEK